MPALLLLLLGVAWAQDAVRLEVTRKGLVAGPPPALAVVPQVDLDELVVAVDCGGTRARAAGPARVAEAVRLDLAAPLGRHACTGRLTIRLADGSEGEMPLAFEIEVVAPLSAQVARAELDLAGGQLRLRANRPLAGAEVLLFGASGEIGRANRTRAEADGSLIAGWIVPEEELLRIEIKALDEDGFGARVELFPWSYEIPHEDVVFETGQASVRPGELPKLQAAWTELQAVLARYGSLAVVNLYVAGFTDTVGGASANQALSQARARAIARWFRDQGFQGSIFYQGFGEAGLAVPGPDELDEERNRRATYILAAEPPPESAVLPGSAWRPVD